MKTINLNETLQDIEKQVIKYTLTPLRIDQLVQYMEKKPLSTTEHVLANIGLLNGDYYLMENVHEELAHYYKNDTTRKECFNCDNLIQNEGDAFCTKCDGRFYLEDTEVLPIKSEV